MPESPEVQILTEVLDDRLVSHAIVAVELEEFRALKTRGRPLDELIGSTVTAVRRFGKHVDIETTGAHLVISFGRAGWALLTSPGEEPQTDAAVLARIRFDDDSVLTVTDAGSFLSLGLSVADAASDVPAIAKLGPDPTDPTYTSKQFDAVLVGRRKQLRALLQEQESIAGIGGAYSDEILYAAGLSPLVHAAELTAPERERLFTAMRQVLTEATSARRGIPLPDQKAAKVAAMNVHGRAGEPCPDGDGTVLDVPGSKGGAQYCPGRQTGGVPLA
ncbi:DNA-formamidopyrimidine glycosylase family protein [Microbacterium sp. P04]|uniref:DNA-formamidopyrimidine glycosylase family protein n=1 Tax=Microbacterium sp. P04 TaxID=3366947 RepID=UPI00374619F4